MTARVRFYLVLHPSQQTMEKVMNDLKNLAEKIRTAVNEAVDGGIFDDVAETRKETGKPEEREANIPPNNADHHESDDS